MNTAMARFIPFDGEVQTGAFVERLNRFVARIEVDGEMHLAHVPNSGRMRELLTPGAQVGVVPREGAKRRTRWDLTIVAYRGVWVAVDSRLANLVVDRLLASAVGTAGASRLLEEAGSPGEAWRGFRALAAGVTGIRREAKVGRHVIDFLLDKGERRALLEVKSVNLVEGSTALFPDAPTVRGREHVELLAASAERGEEAHLLFVVLRGDARRCAPHTLQDPGFALALERAKGAGVGIGAIACSVSPEGVELLGTLPVDV